MVRIRTTTIIVTTTTTTLFIGQGDLAPCQNRLLIGDTNSLKIKLIENYTKTTNN